jgi:integrase
MPHRPNKRTNKEGCYRVDRVFRGVGRIAQSSGAKTVGEFRKRDALLTSLYDTGRLDVLKAIKDRRLSIPEVYSADRTGQIGFVATDVVLDRRFWDVYEDWKDTAAEAASTRKRYQCSFTSLSRLGVISSDAKLRALEDVDWDKLRQRWRGGPADWNHLGRALSRFLTMVLGDVYHPFRRKVVQRIPKASTPPGRVPDLTPELFWKLVKTTPDHVQASYVTLVLTGMRVGEYLACTKDNLRPHTHSIEVPGTKTEGSAAVVQVDPSAWDWIEAAIPSTVAYKWLRIHFKRACEVLGLSDLTLHDLRHCTGQWLVNAGRPEASVQQTLRHSDPSMTRRYTRQKMKGEDAAAMACVVLPERRLKAIEGF